MENIVVFGSINIDFVCNVKNFPKVGETIKADSFQISPGGKGANQAVAVAKLGEQVSMIGKVGNDDYGIHLIDMLAKENIETDYIKQEGTTGQTFINVDNNGDNIITYVPGANNLFSKYDIDKISPLFTKAKYLILQQEIPYKAIKYIIELASKTSCEIILNAAPAGMLENEILQNINTLIVNETELEFINGGVLSGKDEIVEASKKILSKGIEKIIVTLGSKGSIYVDNNQIFENPAKKVKAVDTTGAGDAFIGAYVVGLNRGNTDKESIEFATKVSGLTVMNKGAQESIPTLTEYHKLEKSI